MADELLNNLKDAIDDPKSTAEDILLNPGFNSAFQKEYPPLIEFFKRDETIKFIAENCFNPQVAKSGNFKKVQQVSAQILTSTLPSIFRVFINSHILSKTIHDFLTDNPTSHPYLCGLLYQVISQQIRWGDPILFRDYLDTGILFLRSIQNFAIQELIVIISTKNDLTIFQEMNMILLLSEIMISQMDEASASTLVQIYDNISDDSPLMTQYQNSQVIQNIIDFCIDSKFLVLSIDLLNIASQIIDCSSELRPIILKKKNVFQIRKDNINFLSVAMIHFFSTDALQLFSLYFEPNACKLLHNHLINLILSLKMEEIVQVAHIPNLLDRIATAYNTSSWCPHMIQLVVIFEKVLPKFDKNYQNKNWTDFMNSVGCGLIQVLEQPYGGPIMRTISEFSFDDIFEEEEEEEANDIVDS